MPSTPRRRRISAAHPAKGSVSASAPGASAVAAASPAGEVSVTRQVHFNAGHRLDNPARSAAWNRRTYGPCNNPGGHGHNYVLEVTVCGTPDPETGYVVDLGRLKEIVTEAVVERCDHRNLNTDVDFLRGVIPTTENLVVAFWGRIAPLIPRGRLSRLRLFETPRNFADYHGP